MAYIADTTAVTPDAATDTLDILVKASRGVSHVAGMAIFIPLVLNDSRMLATFTHLNHVGSDVSLGCSCHHLHWRQPPQFATDRCPAKWHDPPSNRARHSHLQAQQDTAALAPADSRRPPPDNPRPAVGTVCHPSSVRQT